MKGTIYDIQKFALHDGPGIRTVVFFKGCPLRCAWCSNPESFSREPMLAQQKQKCTLCGDCIPACPEKALILDNNMLRINRDICTLCGDCLPACVPDALRIIGNEMDVPAIMKEILKDKAYYDASGGGITLSGGEVLLQWELAFGILSECKKNNIHTCIETSGCAPVDRLQALIPVTDLFLYDFKLLDPAQHQQFTRQTNEGILANLEYLYQKNARIILRCPIIPGINDTPDHFISMAELSKKYSKLAGIEILPYHNWGQHKYSSLDLPVPEIESETVNREQAENWLDQLRSLGCSNVSIG